MSHLASMLLTVCVSAVDWIVTPLLGCASVGQGGAGGWQTADPGRNGGEKNHFACHTTGKKKNAVSLLVQFFSL